MVSVLINRANKGRLTMYNSKFTKLLHKISGRLLNTHSPSLHKNVDENAGFSLIEMVAVVLMVGILGAIAVPSWLSFVNKQKLNKANDAILSALRTAQTEARRQKLAYSVSFLKNSSTGIPQYAVYSGTGYSNSSNWKNLLSELNTNSSNLSIYTNITAVNTGNTSSTTLASGTVPPTSKPTTTITFDYTGAVSSDNTGGLNYLTSTSTKGLIVSVTANSITRCVMVQTLLGATATGKDSTCTP
jgi:prepilin-type N-terminal cleavage/methylation domain-containing protein